MSKKNEVTLYDMNVCGPGLTGTLSAADRAYIKALLALPPPRTE